jgi:parallel beta-helix repeat protein
MTNSIVRDNYLYNQQRAIHVSQSHNNEIYNNTVSNSKSAIILISNSSANKVHDNNIMNVKNPLRIDPGLDQVNTLYANRIDNNSTPNSSSPPDTSPTEQATKASWKKDNSVTIILNTITSAISH